MLSCSVCNKDLFCIFHLDLFDVNEIEHVVVLYYWNVCYVLNVIRYFATVILTPSPLCPRSDLGICCKHLRLLRTLWRKK